MKTNKSQSIEQRLAQCNQQYEHRRNQHRTQPTIPINLIVKCSNTVCHKIQNQLKQQENNTQNIIYEVKKRRPIPFLDDFEKKSSNNGVRSGLHRVFGKLQTKEKMNSHKKLEGKTEKDFKNCPHYAKHAFFAAEVSRQIVARYTRQNTSSQKF